MTPTTSLTDAFAAVEAAQTTLTSADTANANAQAKLTAAQAAVTSTATDEATATTAFNAAVDGAIAALKAAKRPSPPAA